jgi:hypothetical protein
VHVILIVLKEVGYIIGIVLSEYTFYKYLEFLSCIFFKVLDRNQSGNLACFYCSIRGSDFGDRCLKIIIGHFETRCSSMNVMYVC